ncbi:glycolate oxidase [Mycolicibacterium canariasense]|uniref:Glycolate oxidase n=1 Tax=Mycolicibacterium canariasense TaxID=228230 RepID=A0A100WHD5_MYCCR|nr:alpha-hydroxy acid oxidase [Mycolicibacterium canariasense]MCV7211793.1 alpha-hydroxy-acid oxidizing protein [Mycolicibacterium canariasense]ORV08140.1 alpha-hydroxy-acid oxidizing enzyme [Mycolicibacterium canariasense]GAS98322.1 glycolate oxidase [Mycolicibacterium canariasense]
MTTSAISSMYPQDVDFAALEEIRDSALQTLAADVRDFLEGGAGGEATLRANRSAFERRVIRPRPMSGVNNPRTDTTFLGIPLAVPILTAPFGGDALFHPQGQLAVARANATCGTASIVPEAGTYSYEQVAQAAPTSAVIAQLHPFEHFEVAAQRAQTAGYRALCVTVDCPTAGFRVRNRMNRFDPDLSYFAGNTVGEGAPDVAEMFGRLVNHGAPTWDWDRLAEATNRCGMPWIAKGVLTAEAAVKALEAGADAIVVSNHGGRQIDPAPASLDALPEVVAAVAGQVPIAFDSGVRNGSDLFLALALGADVVVLGRLAVYGLAARGEAGVRRTIELLADELRTLMILAGASSLADLDATMVGTR